MASRADFDGLDALISGWLSTCRSSNTRAAYELDLRAFVAWCDGRGQHPLTAAPTDLRRYRRHCLASGASAATVARRLSSLSSFYRHALAAEALRENPVAHVARPPVVQPRATALDEADVAALWKAAGELGPKVQVLVGLLLLDGLKLGEALALDVADVTGTVRVMTVAVTRRGHCHDIRLDRRTSSAIVTHRGGRNEGPLLMGSSPTRSAGRLTRFGADFLLKRAADRAGLAQTVSANVLRSSYIRTARRRGAGIDEIRDQVGHVHARDTRRYLA